MNISINYLFASIIMEFKMKKVAIINSVIDYGSTGLLTRQLYEYGCLNGCDAFVFFGRGKKKEDDRIIRIDSKLDFYFHKIMTLITGYQGLFSRFATKRLIEYLKKEKINNVILLNLHGYYLNEKQLLSYLKDNKIKTVYITPDEYAGLGKCCYSKDCNQYKMECKKCPYIHDYPKSLWFDRSNYFFKMKKELYSEFNTLVFVGPESNLVKFRESALIKDKPMIRASWGIDLNYYKYEINEKIYSKYHIPKEKIIVLTVAKYSDDRKGVKRYFFEIAKRLQNSEYHFINVGYDGNLRPEEIPTNMTLIGYMDNQKELAQIYSLSDAYLLASTTDTMPISCLISFACETPICCFYTSGLKYLADRDSKAVQYCDELTVDALQTTICSMKKKTSESMHECRKLAMNEYSIDAFNRKVFGVLEGE